VDALGGAGGAVAFPGNAVMDGGMFEADTNESS